MMRKLTIEKLKAAKPCDAYTDERIKSLFAGREELTPQDIASLLIPHEDKVWAFADCLLTEKECRLFAVACARRALAGIEAPDPRSINAVDVAERHANGEATDEELSAVGSAAWSAARSAAWYAARSAAWYAAWSAARSAAWYAAWYAARYAAWPAEQGWQLNELVKICSQLPMRMEVQR